MTKARNFLDVIFVWMMKHKFFTLLFLVLVVGGSVAFGYYENQEKKNTEIYSVERKDLSETVSLTGTVKPNEEANLSFEKEGIVKEIFVKLGDNVEAGQPLAKLSTTDDEAKVLEAKANLESAKAQLSDVSTGAKTQTIEIKQAAVDKASSDQAQAYKNAGDSIRNIAIYGNTYVRDNLSSYFTGNFTDGYNINVASCDSLTESKVNNLKKQAEQNLQTIESISANYETSSNDSKEKSIELVRNNLMPNISVYLNALKDLFSANCMSSNSNYDSARTTISTSRNNWSTLSTDLTVKQTAINNSKIALTQATSDLQLSQTGDKSSRVDQQVALVQAAYARLKTAESAASKNILVAPFTGIITSIDLKKGELVSPNKAQVSMISDNNFQIESKVSEIDVAKLSVGATTTVHFDAYGDDVKFKAVVSNISLAAIVSEGVPTYKTIFNFLDKDERIRSGMTANIDAVTKLHENVLTIPAKFLLTNNGKKQVNVVDPKDGSDYTTKNIVIGARGQNGDIEVVDGLKENDILVIEK